MTPERHTIVFVGTLRKSANSPHTGKLFTNVTSDSADTHTSAKRIGKSDSYEVDKLFQLFYSVSIFFIFFFLHFFVSGLCNQVCRDLCD